MTKEELALEIIRRLKKEYPDAGCTLDYNEAWKLLVSVRLAAQCTDARVNVVVQDSMRNIRTCRCPGRGRARGDRSHRKTLRSGKKQSPGHQRLYAVCCGMSTAEKYRMILMPS